METAAGVLITRMRSAVQDTLKLSGWDKHAGSLSCAAHSRAIGR
jgi:hypothetical protein